LALLVILDRQDFVVKLEQLERPDLPAVKACSDRPGWPARQVRRDFPEVVEAQDCPDLLVRPVLLVRLAQLGQLVLPVLVD